MKKNNMRLILISASILFLLVQIYSVSAVPIVCTTCQVGSCNCNVPICPSTSGMLGVFRTTGCSGVPAFKIQFTGNAAVWSPDTPGTYYIRALCDDRMTQSDCSTIVVAGTSSSATSTSTSTSSNETTTTEGTTQTTTSGNDTGGGGGGSGMGLWLGIIIVVIIVVVIVFFLLTRKTKSKSSGKASYEDLYRKWSR